MNRIVIVLVSALVIFVAAVATRPPAAVAGDSVGCMAKKSCSGTYPCWGEVTSRDPECAYKYQVGTWHTAYTGQRCNVIAAPGASGCVQVYRGVFFADPEDCPVGEDGCCKLVASASLVGIGCCGYVCPPLTPGCHPELKAGGAA